MNNSTQNSSKSFLAFSNKANGDYRIQNKTE